jgi:hypothetical protein
VTAGIAALIVPNTLPSSTLTGRFQKQPWLAIFPPGFSAELRLNDQTILKRLESNGEMSSGDHARSLSEAIEDALELWNQRNRTTGILKELKLLWYDGTQLPQRFRVACSVLRSLSEKERQIELAVQTSWKQMEVADKLSPRSVISHNLLEMGRAQRP